MFMYSDPYNKYHDWTYICYMREHDVVLELVTIWRCQFSHDSSIVTWNLEFGGCVMFMEWVCRGGQIILVDSCEGGAKCR